MRVTRRSFLQVTALSGGGMMLGMYAVPKAQAQAPQQPPFDAKAFIRIAPDGTVTLAVQEPRNRPRHQDHAADDDCGRT